MAHKTTPPHLSYNQIRKLAENFLDRYHHNLDLPIPIEEIVEFDFNIKLSTLKNLKSECDCDGFINSSFDHIYIDDFVFNTFEERSRFTIGHEVAHKILHEEIYKGFNIRTKEDYLNFQNKIPSQDQGWINSQANSFAACVLVPTRKLFSEATPLLEKKGLTDYSFPRLQELPKKFNVSPEVLYWRMKKEKLLK